MQYTSPKTCAINYYRHEKPKTMCTSPLKRTIERSGCYDQVKRMDLPAWDLPRAEKIRRCQEHSHGTCGYYIIYSIVYAFHLKQFFVLPAAFSELFSNLCKHQ